MKLRPTKKETIKFTIKQDGTVIEEVENIEGGQCINVTKEIEDKLGVLATRSFKPEYYKQEVKDVSLQHNTDTK